MSRAAVLATGRAGRAVTSALLVADAVLLAALHWHAATSRWRLIGDPAVTVLRGRDVFSAHPPLLGMPSGFSAWSPAADPFHPGPVALWPLAPTAIFGASEGVVLVITWLVAVLSTVLVAAAARRVAGWWAAAGAVTMAIWLQVGIAALPGWTPIPPVLAALPALALAFVVWVVVAGRATWWPGLIAVATLVAGADLAYATIVIPLVVLAIARTARDVRRARAEGRPSPLPRRTAWLTLLALTVTCMLPVVDAVTNGGGNVEQLLSAAVAPVPTAGFGRAIAGLRSVVMPNPLVLIALLVVSSIEARRRDLRTVHLVAGLSGLLIVGIGVGLVGGAADLAVVVVALSALAFVGHPFRATAPRALLAVTATVVVGALLGQWQTPAAAGVQAMYLLPVDIATAMFWFTVGMIAARAVREVSVQRAAESPWTDPRVWPRMLTAAGGAVGILLLAITGAGARDQYLPATSQGLGSITRQLDDSVADGTYRWAALGGPDVTAVGHGVALRAIPRGVVPHVELGIDKYYGADRRIDGTERGALYLTLGSGGPPVEGARRLATWEPRGGTPVGADALAARIRRRTIAIAPTASSPQVGTVIAGFGGLPAPAGAEIDGDYLYDLGERMRADPQELANLPDEAIVELAAQGLLDATLSEDDRSTVERQRERYPITIWRTDP